MGRAPHPRLSLPRPHFLRYAHVSSSSHLLAHICLIIVGGRFDRQWASVIVLCTVTPRSGYCWQVLEVLGLSFIPHTQSVVFSFSWIVNFRIVCHHFLGLTVLVEGASCWNPVVTFLNLVVVSCFPLQEFFLHLPVLSKTPN